MNRTITAVPGIRAGHAGVEGGGSGCTVLRGPFRGACRVGGMATGTRELGALEPTALAGRADALVLTGGSALGLASTDGVAGWLRARGEGFPTPGGPVPIVPAAVIFDLREGVAIPGPDEGRRACEAASAAPLPSGRVGAGTGALVGKVLGPDRADPGGIASTAGRMGPWTLGALAVVNAFGDVVGGDGTVLAGARDVDGLHADTARILTERGMEGGFGGASPPGTNTTLCVVATDVPLSRTDLLRVATSASTALGRCIRPVNTPFDGDILFALSTSEEEQPREPGELLVLSETLTGLLVAAIREAVGGA